MGLTTLFMSSLFAGHTASTAKDYRKAVREAAEQLAQSGTVIVSVSATDNVVVIYPTNTGTKQHPLKNNDTIKAQALKMIDADKKGSQNDAVIHLTNEKDRYVGSVIIYSMSQNRMVSPDPSTASKIHSHLK